MENKKKAKSEVRIDNARITFRNFAGAEGKFNPPGNRNFGIFLPEDVAKQMEADGWTIKWLNSYEEEPPQALLNVKLKFENYPPNVYLVSDGQKTRLDADNIDVLDFAELSQVDVILRPYEWKVSGKTGIKAYLKTGYFVLVVDELAKKYSQPDDSDVISIAGGDNHVGEVPF